jgi:hypothetical protein
MSISAKLRSLVAPKGGQSGLTESMKNVMRSGETIYEGGAGARQARDLYLRDLIDGYDGRSEALANATGVDMKMKAPVGGRGLNPNQYSQTDELESRLMRQKGLARLAFGATSENKMRLLQDRAAAAKMGRNVQAAGLRALGQRAEIEGGILQGQAAARQIRDASKGDLLGTLGGIGLGLGYQAWKGRTPSTKTGPTAPFVDIPEGGW